MGMVASECRPWEEQQEEGEVGKGKLSVIPYRTYPLVFASFSISLLAARCCFAVLLCYECRFF